jgi:hypothetical protein
MAGVHTLARKAAEVGLEHHLATFVFASAS